MTKNSGLCWLPAYLAQQYGKCAQFYGLHPSALQRIGQVMVNWSDLFNYVCRLKSRLGKVQP
jgi:hypothetical protein